LMLNPASKYTRMYDVRCPPWIQH